MPDYSETFARLSGEIGTIRAQLGGLIGSFGEARTQDRKRCEEVLKRLEQIGDELADHDSKSDHHTGAVDEVTAELYGKLKSTEELLKQLVDRKMFWQPILQTLIKASIPASLGSVLLAIIWFLLQNMVELGAALTGWLR